VREILLEINVHSLAQAPLHEERDTGQQDASRRAHQHASSSSSSSRCYASPCAIEAAHCIHDACALPAVCVCVCVCVCLCVSQFRRCPCSASCVRAYAEWGVCSNVWAGGLCMLRWQVLQVLRVCLFSPSQSLSLALSRSRSLSLSLSRSLALSLSRSLAPSLPLSRAHAFSLFSSLFLSLSNTHTLSLSLFIMKGFAWHACCVRI